MDASIHVGKTSAGLTNVCVMPASCQSSSKKSRNKTSGNNSIDRGVTHSALLTVREMTRQASDLFQIGTLQGAPSATLESK